MEVGGRVAWNSILTCGHCGQAVGFEVVYLAHYVGAQCNNCHEVTNITPEWTRLNGAFPRSIKQED